MVPNLFWLVEHLSPGKVLAEHFRPKKPLTEHLNPKILHFYMNFKVSKNLSEHLGPACGTLVFRGTVVGNHWTRYFKMIYYQNSLDLRFKFCQFVYLWNVTRPSSSTTDSQRQNEWEWEKKNLQKITIRKKIVLKRSYL